MKHNGIQTAFNGGELSPLILGRPDVAKYANGCARMENFIPTIQGPAISRPGFVYVGEVKDSSDRTWLLRFEKSVEDSYIMEFGDGYVRFYTAHGQVEVSGVAAWVTLTAYAVGDLASSGGINYYCTTAHTSGTFATDLAAGKWHALTGAIYEIPSPYGVADLTNTDGTLALRYAQTGDVVYLAHSSFRPRKLSKYSGTRWVMEEVAFDPPPFQQQNSTSTTIYASSATGSVTLTASASVFSSAMVGEYVWLGEKDVRSTKLWESGKSITAGDERRSDGKNFVALNTATTGNVKPVHSEGAYYDGDAGVQWQFNDAGFGLAQITAYTSPTQVTATVVSTIPTNCVGAGNPSTRWAIEAWNSTNGYPDQVTFFRERLVYARNETLWFSVSADFENFSYEIDGVVSADAGFDRTIASDRVNAVRWLSPGDVLLVGTLGDEWAVTEATTSDPFGPANCKTKRQSTYGSSRVAPVRIGNDTLFVQRSGRKVRAMSFKFEEDGFDSPDVTAFAEHVTLTNLVDMAYQQEPWSIAWAARTDGTLVGLSFSREQDVVAWHQHPMDGAMVECVECIPAPTGGHDELWIVARYTINGATKRYLAYMAAAADSDTAQENWLYSDMVATYNGAAATTISGLDHLEGETVWVLRDGARHPTRTVSAGAITLQEAGSVVQVGLPSTATLETMPLETASPSGTGQGKTKRVHLVTLRVLHSLGGMAGPDEDTLTEIRYRYPSAPMGSAPAAYTGDMDIEWPGDYDKNVSVLVRKDRPMPMTVVCIMPQTWVSDGR